MRLAYPIKLQEVPEDHGFAVIFPDLPEAITWGDTREDALINAVDCLEEALAGYIKQRREIPAPSLTRGRPTVAPGSLIASKAALYLALRRSGVRQSTLARRMGVPPSMVTRLLDPAHASKPAQLDAALVALKHRLVVTLEAA